MLANGEARLVYTNDLREKPSRRRLHIMDLPEVDPEAFELFAWIVHHKAPPSKPIQTNDIIALAILTQKLRCQNALRPWVMTQLPEVLPLRLPIADTVLQPSSEWTHYPNSQLVNATLVAYLFDIPTAFWECTRLLYRCVEYEEESGDLVDLKLLPHAPKGLFEHVKNACDRTLTKMSACAEAEMSLLLAHCNNTERGCERISGIKFMESARWLKRIGLWPPLSSPNGAKRAGVSVQNLMAALKTKEQESKEGWSFLDDSLSDCLDSRCAHNFLSSLRNHWDCAVELKGLCLPQLRRSDSHGKYTWCNGKCLSEKHGRREEKDVLDTVKTENVKGDHPGFELPSTNPNNNNDSDGSDYLKVDHSFEHQVPLPDAAGGNDLDGTPCSLCGRASPPASRRVSKARRCENGVTTAMTELSDLRF